jgi:glutathione synthase/RimK-type ligase-like ATP-grasp enzyme
VTRILLATFAGLPDGGDERSLPAMFADRGIDARWAVWDDADVDWASADLVAIRMTWDYVSRLDEFLSWARGVASSTRLVNDPAVIAWNADKSYLAEIPTWGIATVPTVVVGAGAPLADALVGAGPAVVKPAVGLGGEGLSVWRPGDGVPVAASAMVVQPLVDSVRTSGEVSVYVMARRAVAQIVKRPPPGSDDIRVHEHRGGRYEAVPLTPALVEVAERAIAEVSRRFGVAVPYARVDFLDHDGSWAVSELELIEPSLYVNHEPRLAPAYVDAVSSLV